MGLFEAVICGGYGDLAVEEEEMAHTRDGVYVICRILHHGVLISMIMSPWGRHSNASLSDPAPIHQFEVVSIKLNVSDSRVTNIRSGVDTFDAKNVTPKTLLQLAYGLKSFQIAGGPKWLETLHLDLHAKVQPQDVTPGVRLNISSLQEALQQLLAERFALKTHEETRDAEVDDTQLSGRYDLNIKLAEDSTAVSSDEADRAATLIAALKVDCGLVLRKGNAPQRFLVIEQMRTPSED